jgi:hypothetical protein
MTDIPPPPVITQEVRIVDAQGATRILLSAKEGVPTIVLLRADGKNGASVSLDDKGHPALRLVNPSPDGPIAAVEIDEKGAHVKFDGPRSASSYLFLNNEGGSGVILIDKAGKRRVQALVAADGSSEIERLDEVGKPLP